MNELQIAILIPVFNGLDFTTKCIAGLNRQLHDLGKESSIFKIVVINDGSTDDTKEWILNNYPDTELVNGDGTLWWSGSINAGCRHAFNSLGCNYVLWWNNDIEPDNEYFRNILKIASETNSDTITGSKIYFADKPEVIWSMGGIFNTRTGKKFITGYEEVDSEKYNENIAAEWLPGMGTLIPRQIFEKIGFVNDKEFPQYHGDSDFTFRAHLAGIKIFVSPQLKIWNDKSNSGILHGNSYKKLRKSLFSIKSNYHMGKDILFYRKYATSPIAYFELIKKYFFYIGGFFKWKLMHLWGSQKQHTQ